MAGEENITIIINWVREWERLWESERRKIEYTRKMRANTEGGLGWVGGRSIYTYWTAVNECSLFYLNMKFISIVHFTDTKHSFAEAFHRNFKFECNYYLISMNLSNNFS